MALVHYVKMGICCLFFACDVYRVLTKSSGAEQFEAVEYYKKCCHNSYPMRQLHSSKTNAGIGCVQEQKPCQASSSFFQNMCDEGCSLSAWVLTWVKKEPPNINIFHKGSSCVYWTFKTPCSMDSSTFNKIQ